MTNGASEIPLEQTAAAPGRPKPVAPVWHTIPLLVVIVGLSALQGLPKLRGANIQPNRVFTYSATLVYELIMLAWVWVIAVIGYKVPLREIIGGKWRKFADFFMDIGIALLFWCAVAVFLLTAHYVFKFSGVDAAKSMLPATDFELGVFIVLAVFAGFCEEVVFRGYFMRQFTAWTGNVPAGVILQGIVFGLAHGYQGWKGMLVISAYGAMFGILAALRKSLRPGMIQHCGQDALSGIVFRVATKLHMAMPMIRF